MQFDYLLTPTAGPFTVDDLTWARERIAELVVHPLDDTTYTVFSNPQKREVYLPYLVEHPDEPDWLNGYVVLGPERIVLGLVHDDGIAAQLYDLALAVQQRRPDARFSYNGAETSVAEIRPPLE